MKLSDFDYSFPREFIASYPEPKRSEARLLVLNRKSGKTEHRVFKELTAFLQPGDLLVLNNTKVLPARLFGRKPTGGRVEVLLLKSLGPETWQALLKPSRRVPKGGRVTFEEKGTFLEAELEDGPDPLTGIRTLKFLGDSVRQKLDEIGRIPLPPYIDRPDGPADRELYQTVFAEVEGAVASPTAGLHFDKALLDQLKAQGVETAFVTLHVSYGTFQPVQVEDISKHEMYEEEFEVPAETAEQIRKARREKRRIVACGTTVVRTLEHVGATHASPLQGPLRGKTRLFIYPPHSFKLVDVMITNFHLPKSTLLMLTSAFAGHELLMKAYREAIAQRYRFYSYGDAMLIV